MALLPHLTMRCIRRRRVIAGSLILTATAEATLIYLGRTFGATAREQVAQIPGDDIVAKPQVVTNHAITIDAPPESVWPWLAQMGWHRAGWYTARWVDRRLFPANWNMRRSAHPGAAGQVKS